MFLRLLFLFTVVPLVELFLLLLPAMLMGATLPIIARALVRSVPEIGWRVGRLYGANTLGAATVSFVLSGPWLLGSHGIEGALGLGAVLNLVACCCILVSLGVSRLLSPESAAPVPSREPADSLGDPDAPPSEPSWAAYIVSIL